MIAVECHWVWVESPRRRRGAGGGGGGLLPYDREEDALRKIVHRQIAVFNSSRGATLNIPLGLKTIWPSVLRTLNEVKVHRLYARRRAFLTLSYEGPPGD